MLPPNDVIADLPSPLDDEPPSVRQDIADELSDHLACAYRRELLKTADEGTAQQRVLDRFGNPRRIAYQLWFQALWGRIMLNRFARVWQGLKIVAGLVVLFMFVRMAEQQSALHNQLQFMSASYNNMQMQAMGNRSLLEQLLARLPAPPPSPEGSGMPMGGMGDGSPMGMASSGMMPATMGGEGGSMAPGGSSPMMGMGPMVPGTEAGSMAMPGMGAGPASAPAMPPPDLIVRLTIEGDEAKPASGCVVALVNEFGGRIGPSRPNVPNSNLRQRLGAEPTFGVQLSLEHRGEVHFEHIKPGRYTAAVEFDDGRQCAHRFVIVPGTKAKPHVEHIRCPESDLDKMAYTVVRTSPLPSDLAEANFSVCVHLARQFDNLTSGWHLSSYPSWRVTCEAMAGTPNGFVLEQNPDVPRPTDWMHKNRFRSWRNLADLDVNERFLSLSAGKYRVWLTWLRGFKQPELDTISEKTLFAMRAAYFPAGPSTDGIFEISTDTREIQFELPEAMLQAARYTLLPPAEPEGTAPAAETKTLSDPDPQ